MPFPLREFSRCYGSCLVSTWADRVHGYSVGKAMCRQQSANDDIPIIIPRFRGVISNVCKIDSKIGKHHSRIPVAFGPLQPAMYLASHPYEAVKWK